MPVICRFPKNTFRATMQASAVIFFIYFTATILAEGPSITQDAKIDSKHLKCLVCEKSIGELEKAIKSLDPNKKVDVGGHRLDVDGNYRRTSISQSKSELVISEIIESICEKMDNYVRAVWKSNGTLTVFSMITEDGGMNPNFSDVDIVQDDDLNKSLKYHCEDIMGEHEDSIVKYFQEGTSDLYNEFCVKDAKLCNKKKKKVEL